MASHSHVFSLIMAPYFCPLGVAIASHTSKAGTAWPGPHSCSAVVRKSCGRAKYQELRISDSWYSWDIQNFEDKGEKVVYSYNMQNCDTHEKFRSEMFWRIISWVFYFSFQFCLLTQPNAHCVFLHWRRHWRQINGRPFAHLWNGLTSIAKHHTVSLNPQESCKTWYVSACSSYILHVTNAQ